MRTATVERNTKETQIAATLCLDGGEVAVSTGNGFFDHMLTAFAVHGGFGLQLTVQGDLEVDTHHTVEDTGIVLGAGTAPGAGGGGFALKLAGAAADALLPRATGQPHQPSAAPFASPHASEAAAILSLSPRHATLR